MSSRSIASRSPHSQLTRTTYPTMTTCNLWGMAGMNAGAFGAIPDGNGLLLRNIAFLRFGFRTEIPGAIAPSLQKFACRSTGRFTSATMKRRPMQVGQEKNCRAKRNGIAPLTALAAAANARTLGARKRQPHGTAILISSVGTRLRWDLFRTAAAASAPRTAWGRV